MVIIFFANAKLLIVSDLPKGQKSNQDYFISDIFSELEREKRDINEGSDVEFLCAHEPLQNHNGGKIQEKFKTKGFVCSPHPPYSPDLSPCDFWFFGMAKGKMTDRKFHTIQNILGGSIEI
jgi:hypothetical protein